MPGTLPADVRAIDVLSVGDVTTDVFIRLLEARVVDAGEGDRRLELPYGGKVRFEHAETVAAGGNSSNAAVCFARLGLAAALVANVGGDQVGRDVLTALHREGVDTRFVRIDPGLPTNRNFVLWYGDERTILVHHESYEYHWPHLRPSEVPRWLYLSSLGDETLEYYGQLADWLEAEPAVRLAFQPGTFQIQLGTERLARLYRRADLLVCNREEAAVIGGGRHADVADLLDHLHALGPRVAVVTDGPAGAYASDGRRRYRVPCYPDREPPLERTGAGDAFAATLVAALARGLPLEVGLAWAPANAMSVVHRVGSQGGLLTEKELEAELEQAPPGYAVRPL